MSEITYEIHRHLGVLSKNTQSGWQKELNLVSWNGEPAKYDIRSWDSKHEKCSKGSTFTTEEVRVLKTLLNKQNEI